MQSVGSMEDTWSVFNKMPSRNVVTWTTILGGCAIHGHGKEALNILNRCLKKVYNQMISLLIVFSQLVCSHAGVADEAMCCYASSMVTEYMILQNPNITPCWQCWPSAGGREYGHGNALSTTCGCLDGLAQRLQNSW
jgi:hypothetical protein